MKIKRFFWCFTVVFLLFGCITTMVLAQPSAQQKLTIFYKDQHTPIVDCEFQIYYVASLNSSGQYVATKPFEGYSLVFSKDTIHQLSYTLEGYVLRDGIIPTKIGKTGEFGTVTYENLSAGLYLVLTQRHIQNDHAYLTNPFVISLAGAPAEVQVFPKSESKPPVPTQQTACKVLKIWDDKGFEHLRPKEIKVDLLKNGRVYDSVKLNESNGWRYMWDDLDATARYVVVEQETKGYLPLVGYQGITYTITNQYLPKEDASSPSNPTLPPSNNNSTPPEKLPQTGQLWWPVPVLLSLGLIFVAIGLFVRRGAK